MTQDIVYGYVRRASKKLLIVLGILFAIAIFIGVTNTMPLGRTETEISNMLLIYYGILTLLSLGMLYAIVMLVKPELHPLFRRLGGYGSPAQISLLYLNRPLLHVLSVTVVGATLMVTDGLLARGLRPGREKKEYRDSFWIAGVPTVFAYLVLVVYLVSGTLYQGLAQKDEAPEIFMSGAISFQLLASNIVFVILQKGWLRRPPKRLKTARSSKTKSEVPA